MTQKSESSRVKSSLAARPGNKCGAWEALAGNNSPAPEAGFISHSEPPKAKMNCESQGVTIPDKLHAKARVNKTVALASAGGSD